MTNGIAIFGASGLIGSGLTKQLISTGRASGLVLFDNKPLPRDIAVSSSVQFIELDLAARWDEAVIVDSLSQVEAVYFKVGVLGDPTRSADNRAASSYLQVNVEVFLRLAAALERTPVRRVIIDSSIAAVAQPHRRGAICEDADPRGPMNFYGMSKAILEDLAHFFQKRSGKQVYVFRYPRVHAPRSPDVIWHFSRAVILGRPIVIKGHPEKVLDFVHLDDVLQANERALAIESEWEVFHVTGQTPLTLRALAEKVIALAGQDTHEMLFDDRSPVPVEPLESSLSMKRTLGALSLGNPKGIDLMIAETYALARAANGN